MVGAVRLLIVAVLGLALAGCVAGSGATTSPQPTPVVILVPSTVTVPTPALPPVTSTRVPATPTPAAVEATPAPPTPVPTAAPSPTAAPTGTPAALATAVPTPGGFTSVKVALVALGDEGRRGKRIGCGDSIVLVDRSIPPTTGVLAASMRELLAGAPEAGAQGLATRLPGGLALEGVTITNGVAVIRLTGQPVVAGTCDEPRLEAQIAETALQFSTVRDVAILVNGRTLNQVFCRQGEACPARTYLGAPWPN